MAMHKTRPQAESYGQAVGILLLDASAPFIPGDVGNASSYKYPVIYRTVPGLTTEACLSGAPEFTPKVIEAARWLESQGVRAVSSDCGFMLQYQEAVRAAVRIPVCLSSLLQLPMIARTLDRSRPIAVVTADSTKLTPDFLTRAGIFVGNQLVIRGMQDQPEFRGAVLEEKGTLDSDLIAGETVGVCRQALAEFPNLGAVLLECSMLPPYAKAVQDAVGVPVYDFVSMIDYARAATHRTRYSGFY